MRERTRASSSVALVDGAARTLTAVAALVRVRAVSCTGPYKRYDAEQIHMHNVVRISSTEGYLAEIRRRRFERKTRVDRAMARVE